MLVVEVGSGFVFGMHEEQFEAGDFGGLHRAQDCILEECLSQPLALLTVIDRQAGEQHDRDVIFAQALDEFYREQRLVKRGVNQRIARHDYLANRHGRLGVRKSTDLRYFHGLGHLFGIHLLVDLELPAWLDVSDSDAGFAGQPR